MTRDDLRRLRLRFLLLLVVAFCCIVVSAFQIRIVAGKYSYRAPEFEGMLIAPEQVSFDPAGMAECVNVEYHEDGVPILHLVARERGEGFGIIALENSGGMFQVRVRAGNVLVVDGVNFNGWQWVSGSLMVCMGVAALLCAVAVVRLVRRAWYGYEMAAYLGFRFIDAAEVICFTESGSFDSEKTHEILRERLKNMEQAVIPGFYGAMPDGSIKTFSRGGSDVTGSIVARAVRADVYENWTDVSGVLVADPRIVSNPEVVETITYRELRELSYMGATVLH